MSGKSRRRQMAWRIEHKNFHAPRVVSKRAQIAYAESDNLCNLAEKEIKALKSRMQIYSFWNGAWEPALIVTTMMTKAP